MTRSWRENWRLKMALTDEEIDRIAERVAEKALEQLDVENLLLHSLPYLHGSPGIVVDEERAKASACKCVEYAPGKRLAWSPGIIGALTDEQEKRYCPTMLHIERPGTVGRIRRWQESVDVCKGELAKVPEATGEERAIAWMRCMKRELSARGIEA